MHEAYSYLINNSYLFGRDECPLRSNTTMITDVSQTQKGGTNSGADTVQVWLCVHVLY